MKRYILTCVDLISVCISIFILFLSAVLVVETGVERIYSLLIFWTVVYLIYASYTILEVERLSCYRYKWPDKNYDARCKLYALEGIFYFCFLFYVFCYPAYSSSLMPFTFTFILYQYGRKGLLIYFIILFRLHYLFFPFVKFRIDMILKQYKVIGSEGGAFACSICLVEFKKDETVSYPSQCSKPHFFHTSCIQSSIDLKHHTC